MSDGDTKYETGARKFPSATGADPNEEFSQDAAKNAKPPLGMGLAERLDKTNEKARHAEGVSPSSAAEPVTARRTQAAGEPRPGDDQPRPVPGKDVPIQEPDPDRLPDEEPDPNPDENPEPPMHVRQKQ